MEYRVVRPGTLQVQWARLRNHTSSTFREPVMQRVTYEMHYAVAQVGRYTSPALAFSLPATIPLEEAILSHTPITEENLKKDFNTSEALPYYKYWVEAQVRRSDTSLLYGVSAVVRAVMASWAGHFGSGHLENDDKPFGSEKETPALQKYSGKVRYPFYVGWRGEKNTGCYNYAAVIFIILGAVALVVMSFRIWLGPPTLTSWMGQHVYLAQTDALCLSDKVTDLATGHQVPHRDLGRLRLSPTQSEESMETYAMLQLATMSEEVHNGSRTETAQNSGGERGRALAVADAGGIST
ncbi:hypothetical protein FALBO_11507 [Fusarium albosuccineum]|uniref:Uncharacterized protein n=1 Tax=Fusarium albosuccineum TaxID=1237068 RepID=A0A8H4L4W1_9HYPO|nr:hypothetical protein FALBO_11507 [Fusarium albosuccineum]